MALPLPKLTKEQNRELRKLVLETIKTGEDSKVQLFINKGIFDLSEKQVQHIANAIN